MTLLSQITGNQNPPLPRRSRVLKETTQFMEETWRPQSSVPMGKAEVNSPTWNDCILSVCSDGQPRSSKEIYNVIKSTGKFPWIHTAKTPAASCATMCLKLWGKGQISRSDSKPVLYSSVPACPLLDLRVQEAVKYVLQKLGIKTRDEFLVWRGENGGPKGLLIHSPFYGMIEDISPTHWNTLMYPTAGCRAAYERILPGYKIHSA